MIVLNIKLTTLELVRYNDNYKMLLDDFNGESSSKFISQIEQRLENNMNNNKNFFQSAFVVLDSSMPVGYVFISNNKKDEVFLEYSVLKKIRGKGYGRKIINELSEFLFFNYNIKSVKLDIDPSNKNSIYVAECCGFVLDEEEYEDRNYIGNMVFIKENEYYISKRKSK